MTGWKYLLGPVLGAAIGWTTNWLAVQMLFRPRREVRILGLRFRGLIPKRRGELTERVSDIIAEELILHDDIERLIESADLGTLVQGILEERIDRFLAEQSRQLPRLARRFVTPRIQERLKAAAVAEFSAALPRLTEGVTAAIKEKVDFKQIVVEKLNAVDIEKLEALVRRLARRELRAIELAGGVLGMLIGTVQSLCWWLLG